jgi:Cu(I)/Ag(I) efflux system membrane fusion protein
MTMEFVPANPAIGAKVKPGSPIRFEFVERKPGEWVVTKLEPAASTTTKPVTPNPEAHKH